MMGGGSHVACKRSHDIDLSDLLLTSGGDAAMEAFRRHYPTCRECSEEVRAWTALDASMRSGGGDAGHLAEDAMLRYHEAPDRMAAAERAAAETHLSSCPSCRDELATLRAFAPGALVQPVGVRPAAATAPEPSIWQRLWQGVVWQPAFAYGVLLLVAVPALLTYVTTERPAAYRSLGSAVSQPNPADPALAVPTTLRLSPAWTERPQDETPQASLRELGPELALLISLPLERQEGVMVDVSVSGPAAGRELHDRVPWSEPITVKVPSAWLRAGRYAVKIRPVDPPSPLPTLPLYGFVVR
jgi:hypothetical protein